jgi:hypothetical protein
LFAFGGNGLEIALQKTAEARVRIARWENAPQFKEEALTSK